MKSVYIAHPLSGDFDRNCEAARDFTERAARGYGVAPVAPYLTLYGRFHEPQDRDMGIAIDLALIERCDEVWLCGPRVSDGMVIEMLHANACGIPVFRWLTPDHPIVPHIEGRSATT